MNETYTLLYQVSFMTYMQPDPKALGTAEKAAGKMRLWAKSGEEAIDIARKIAAAKNIEWISLLEVTTLGDIVLEQILNDPLNGYDFMEKVAPPRAEIAPLRAVEKEEPATGTIEVVR